MKHKKRLLLILGAAIIAIAVLAGSCKTSNNVTISRDDGLPVLAYNKFNLSETSKDLYFYKIGQDAQKIASRTNPILDIGNDGSLFVYSCRTGEYFENDVFIVDRDGQQQLLDKGMAYYDIAMSGGKILCYYYEQYETAYVKQYVDNSQIIDVEQINECDSWGINKDASTIVIAQEQPTKANEYSVNNLYFYEDGTYNLIAENAIRPTNKYISDNGTVLFITEFDWDAGAGKLYSKRTGEEPELIAEDVSPAATISEDGAMIEFITKNGKDQLHCMYNGKELELPNSINRSVFCRASNTLAFISSADGQQQLYKVKDGGAPQKIGDAEAIAGISADGSCVVYMNNINADKTAGDLYAVWDGRQPVLVDTHASYSSDIAYIFGFDMMFDINNDGSIIAYCKEYYSDSPTADLYVKQQGEEPILVDTRVALGFRLF